MADREFTFAGQMFQVNKINPMKQYHIVRKLAPILTDLLPVLKTMGGTIKNIDDIPDDEKFEQMAKIITPVMDGLSKYSDDDAELILLRLCEAVEFKQPTGNWARIAKDLNGKSTLMFENLELPVIMYAAGRSLMFNLASFFDILQRRS